MRALFLAVDGCHLTVPSRGLFSTHVQGKKERSFSPSSYKATNPIITRVPPSGSHRINNSQRLHLQIPSLEVRAPMHEFGWAGDTNIQSLTLCSYPTPQIHVLYICKLHWILKSEKNPLGSMPLFHAQCPGCRERPPGLWKRRWWP